MLKFCPVVAAILDFKLTHNNQIVKASFIQHFKFAVKLFIGFR